MRKIVAGMIGILLILASLHYQPVKAADLYVSTLGSDAGNCQILACKTIGYAVGKAASNDTIHVAAGTYNLEATIIISENLTLQGAGAATTTIDGTGSGVDAINVLSALVNISGFTITGDGDGLYYNGSSGIIINNTIAGNDHDGIDNDNSKPTITNNTISGTMGTASRTSEQPTKAIPR